jgi:hypothetical protein
LEILRLRADLISEVHSPLPEYCYLPDNYKLEITSKRKFCDQCDNVRLRIQRTVNRYPIGIILGRPFLRHHIKKCPACGREYPYEKVNAFVPRHGNYTYDIIIEVGLERFQHYRQNKEIQKYVYSRYGLDLPESSINDLANCFLDYLAAVHYAKAPAIEQMIKENGGYVGHFDGTCEVGTDILFTAIDEISGIVLLTGRMPTENTNDIKEFLVKCRNLFGVPLATMRDLSQNISLARNEVFADVPDLICQYHFLENVGKSLFKETHQELSRLLRKLKIKPGLKSLRNGLVRRSKNIPSIPENKFIEFLKCPAKQLQLDNAMSRKYITFLIFRWLDDYCSELKGEYFPFDQPNLAFYRRCVEVYDLLSTLSLSSSPLNWREKQTLSNIVRVLEPVKSDESLVNVAHNLEKEVAIFEELRDILRFKRVDGKPVLRQCPPDTTVKDAGQLEGKLKKFYRQLQTKTNGDDPVIAKSSSIVSDYLDKYTDKLIGHLITMPGSSQLMLLDRTNNISEHRFGKTKTGWRRKLGTKKLSRHLQAARHEEFLIANLNQQNYIDVVYGGSLENMAYCFSKFCDNSLEIRNLRNYYEDKNTMPISKKTLRQPAILLNAVQSLACLFGCESLPSDC